MSRLFASFDYLSRDWETRVLENQSIRAIFIWLLLSVFMLGSVVLMTVFKAVRQHRFDWDAAALIFVFGVTALRNSLLIYRRLGKINSSDVAG